VTVDFPLWLRATHWIDVLFLGFLIRAGIQILGAYPRLYWNDNSAVLASSGPGPTISSGREVAPKTPLFGDFERADHHLP
jgi:hypothetical protein